MDDLHIVECVSRKRSVLCTRSRVIRSLFPPFDADRALRVLLVDNDEAAALRSEEGLRSHLNDRLALIRVSSLTQAVRTLMEMPFDVVVLELDVDDASGIATLAGVRGAAAAVPVVVYARALDDSIVLRALRAGAHECVCKREVPPERLARMLGFAIERQRRLSTIEAARSEATHRATHDPLTGLANRELFLDQLDRALAFGSRYGRKTGILFVDLDGFKEINDTLGHARGDTVLQAVSRRLLESVRRSDAVGRLGGDEFVVLLPDVTSRRDIAFVRDTILECLRAPADVGTGQSVRIEASIGAAMSPLDGESAQELMHAADADMYREKYRRRRGHLLTPVSDAMAAIPGATADAITVRSGGESVSHRGEARLRTAIDRGEFEVHYQPILSAISQRIIAVEALLRWRDPERGLLLPSSFLPLAEDTGLIVPIGESVLKRACEAVVRWRAMVPSNDLRVSVNLSAVQLRDHGFEKRVAAILESAGCPPDALVLELSENSTMVDGEVAIKTLRALKALGLRLLVDDFGVGYASLSFLREAPVDGIKIDRRFIAQMLVDSRDLAIVSSLVRLARGLGLDVVAEGVETMEQSQRLTRLQCPAQQGCYFSDAVPQADLDVMLSQAAAQESDGRARKPRTLRMVGG